MARYKSLPLTAIRRVVRPIMQEVMRAALEEYEELVVTAAAELAPVRQAFQNPKGQKKRTRALAGKYAYLNVGQRGRGARMLIRRRDRNVLNMRDRAVGNDFEIGKVEHYRPKGNYARGTGEISRFRGHRAPGINGPIAYRVTTPGRIVAARSGHGTRQETYAGFRLNQALESQLTPRARSNLARGIGVNRIGAETPANPTGASFSASSGGAFVIGGALRDSIHGMGVEETKNGLEVRITAGVRYAKYVEYGTYKDAAQPFLRPAIKNSKKKLNPIIKKHLRAAGFTAKG